MSSKDLEGLVDETLQANVKPILIAIKHRAEIKYVFSIADAFTPSDFVKHQKSWKRVILNYSFDAYNFYREEQHNVNQSKQLALRDTLSYAIRRTYNSY